MTHVSAIAGDITALEIDAVVNAANSRLAGGGGVDGAIHRAGGPSILEECRAWIVENGALATGEAMVTGGGNLPARHVIHTVGPIWGEHGPDEARRLLARCYYNSLELVASTRSKSVAFPNISTGVFGYPKRDAAAVAVETVANWASDRPVLERIVFVCFDEENLHIYEELLSPSDS